ncbi:MAG: hypothetical protein RLZZ595_1450 [Bacteroidota bacterium]
MNISFNYPNFTLDHYMSSTVKYIIGKSGKKESVLVPIQTWNKLNADYTKLQKKIEVLNGIKESLKEVKSIKKSGKKLQTLKQVLK